jgi:hypothetical protein
MNKITITDTVLNIFIRNNPKMFGNKLPTQVEPYTDDDLNESFNLYVAKYRGYSYDSSGHKVGSKTYTFEM